MDPPSLQTSDEVVTEIMRVHRSLPPRPAIDDVEAANALIRNVDDETQFRLESISKQTKARNVPQDLFTILQEMQRNMAYYNSNEQKRDALRLLDLENVYNLFDDLFQRASRCCVLSSSSSVSDYSNGFTASTTVSSYKSVCRDEYGSVASFSRGFNASSSSRSHYSEKKKSEWRWRNWGFPR